MSIPHGYPGAVGWPKQAPPRNDLSGSDCLLGSRPEACLRVQKTSAQVARRSAVPMAGETHSAELMAGQARSAEVREDPL